MHNSKTCQSFGLAALAVGALLTSQSAFSHTRLETPTAVERTKVHNYLVIGHGCPPTTARNPTYGTTLVWPNAVKYKPVIGVNSGSGIVYTANDATYYYSPSAGIASLINGGGAWDSSNIKVDSLGNKDGFWAGGKSYDQTISTSVLTPFFTAAVTIAPTSCARSVTFYLAVADICNVTTPSTSASDQQVLYWSPIPNFTGVPGSPFGTPAGDPTRSIPVGPKYSNYDGYADAAHTIPGDGWNSPATYKVTRNTTINPLPAGCTGNGGLGDDIHVYPSSDQINQELPVWSKPDQTGTRYWY